MAPPTHFDREKFAYLNIQRVEPYCDPKGEIAQGQHSKLNEAEEVADDHSTFTLFAELPLELQRRIWYFAALSPRVVEVHEVQFYAWIVEASNSGSSKLIVPQRSEITHLRSKTDDPPLLRTCLESRHAATRRYKRADLASEYFADSIYFEFSCDTMYLNYKTMEKWRFDWMNSRRHRVHSLRNLPRYGRTVDCHLRSLAFDASILLHTSVHATPGNSWMVPDPYVCRMLVIFLFDFEALEEVILVLNENHTTTSDGKLSVICFHEPKFVPEVAGSLQQISTLLSKELQGYANERESQEAHVAQNIHRNLGGGAFPTKMTEKRKVPKVRTMVRNLMLTSSA